MNRLSAWCADTPVIVYWSIQDYDLKIRRVVTDDNDQRPLTLSNGLYSCFVDLVTASYLPERPGLLTSAPRRTVTRPSRANR